ncbi:YbaB/EbfC family nucleoid-associated protein [Nocardia sp. NPDC101769]|uniref:YbaB/EbfC family nucleoid-associated protein n=1 Tax=Nocardia sp. NPDC101769 TaxID=3364333 RepID=UPI00381E8D5B
MSADMQALIAQVGDQLEALTLAVDGLTRVTGHATGLDGTITARVAGDGTLTALTLAESIAAHPPDQAAAAILATITAATTAAARQRAELLAHLSDTLT